MRGGDDALTFNLNFSGSLLQGVMKGQDRDNYCGNFTLSYRTKKITLQNNVIATQVVSNALHMESLVNILGLNPYWKPYDENGNINKYLENIFLTGSTGEFCGPESFDGYYLQYH